MGLKLSYFRINVTKYYSICNKKIFRYWLCAAFGPSIKIWDLETKEMVEELRPEVVSQTSKAEPPQCLSLAWSTDGQTLFAGYSDNIIRVWQVSVSTR